MRYHGFQDLQSSTLEKRTQTRQCWANNKPVGKKQDLSRIDVLRNNGNRREETMTDVPQFQKTQDRLLVRAPAKLNLSLLIAGKRPDGFHEIETVMARIDWHDELLIQPGEGPGIELICNGPQWAPPGPDNLVHQAAERIFNLAEKPAAVRLTLTKNVPAGSGLGSASSDAAAALLGLNRCFSLGLSQNELLQTAAELGSDVAFFLNGPLALCRGRGEKITALPAGFDFAALLIMPDINISTAKIYKHYRHDRQTYEQLGRHVRKHLEQNRIDLLAAMCANMLAETCFRLFVEVDRLRKTIESLGVKPVCLSGSGSTLFSILDDHDRERLQELRDEITEKAGCKSFVVRNCRW
jgi:4-diphosphocytidyl-2-C-methyl-D-erythritol kinase